MAFSFWLVLARFGAHCPDVVAIDEDVVIAPRSAQLSAFLAFVSRRRWSLLGPILLCGMTGLIVVLAQPQRSASSNLPLELVVALLIGTALGAGLAIANEYLDRTVYDARTLQREFDQEVLAEIPHFGDAPSTNWRFSSEAWRSSLESWRSSFESWRFFRH
jgi:hypothetical protein